MKKLLLSVLLPLTISANTLNSSHETIKTQIEEIKPPRSGVSNKQIVKVKSPFLYMKTVKRNGKKVTIIEEKKRIKLAPLKLESAINKNAKISGKWYTEGDRVRGYTVMKVSSGEVLLKSKRKELKLYLKQKNDKINFNVN